MPNYHKNLLIAEGIHDIVRLIPDGHDDFTVDFKEFIPEPQTEEEYRAQVGLGYASPEQDYCAGDEDRPWFNWYRWHIDFWGTKWNGFWGRNVDSKTIQFETAWSAPDPVFAKISERLGDKALITVDADEDGGYKDHCYRIWRSGECIFESSYTYEYYEYDDDGECTRGADWDGVLKVPEKFTEINS